MSEFMISDAALATRMQEMQEQSTDFAALLNGFDNTEKSEAVKPGEVNQPKQVECGQNAQPDSQPSEESTEIKSVEVSKDKNVESKDSEDKSEGKNATAEQMTFAVLHAVEIDSEISAEFEEITASLTESAETEEIVPVVSLDGDTEAIVPVQQQAVSETAESGVEIPRQTVDNEQSAEFDMPELTEILKSVDTEDSAEIPTQQINTDNSEEAAVMETIVSETPMAVEENPREVAVKHEASEKVQNVRIEDGTEEIPVNENVKDFADAEVPAEVTAQAAETVTAEFSAKPTGEIKSENRQAKIEPISEENAGPIEAGYSVKSTANAQAEGENGGTDMSGSQKGFEAFESAFEKGEISAPEVRTVTREIPVRSEQSEEKAEIAQPLRVEQPEERHNARRTADSKITSVTEELEMLKNAKTKNAQTFEKANVSTENPLNADTPILLTRADGERVEVRPSEIIEQATAKLIETAQTMKEQATEYSLVLNPEELGRIVVKLVKAADGAVSVSIAADNTRTQRILEQHSAAMQENLRDSGVKLEGWQMVRESEQETYAQDYNGSSKNPYYREENHSQSERESEETNFADLIASM